MNDLGNEKQYLDHSGEGARQEEEEHGNRSDLEAGETEVEAEKSENGEENWPDCGEGRDDEAG